MSRFDKMQSYFATVEKEKVTFSSTPKDRWKHILSDIICFLKVGGQVGQSYKDWLIARNYLAQDFEFAVQRGVDEGVLVLDKNWDIKLGWDSYQEMKAFHEKRINKT